MGRIVIAAYSPREGREKDLQALIREHVPTLRRLRLATDRPVIAMRAGDGTVLEIFEWASQAAIEAAHAEPAVLELWERFGELAEYRILAELTEIQQMFAEFEPLSLDV